MTERLEDMIFSELDSFFKCQGNFREKGIFSKDYFKGRFDALTEMLEKLTGEEVHLVINFNGAIGTGVVKQEAHVFKGTKLYLTYSECYEEPYGRYYSTTHY